MDQFRKRSMIKQKEEDYVKETVIKSPNYSSADGKGQRDRVWQPSHEIAGGSSGSDPEVSG